jgi:hypothetical protein
VRYGLPGLLLGLALASGGRGGGRELWAQGPPQAPNLVPMPAGHAFDRTRGGAPGGEAGGTIAFTTSTNAAMQLLYLIDTRSQAFTIYRVDSTKGTVKLDAARQYGWDLKLTAYNNLGPEVTAIESMVKTQGQPTTR